MKITTKSNILKLLPQQLLIVYQMLIVPTSSPAIANALLYAGSPTAAKLTPLNYQPFPTLFSRPVKVMSK
jgi:hypothetical protein